MNTTKHVVLATLDANDTRGNRPDVVAFEGSWDAAQAVWSELDRQRLAGEWEDVKHFSVRSADDPRAQLAHRGDLRYDYFKTLNTAADRLQRASSVAFRAYKRKKLGELALKAVKDEELKTLHAVVSRVKETAALVGLELYPHEAYDAVKARVHLGRTSPGSGRDRRAYFAPKGLGRLGDLRTPDTGERLFATSSSFSGSFTRLSKEAS